MDHRARRPRGRAGRSGRAREGRRGRGRDVDPRPRDRRHGTVPARLVRPRMEGLLPAVLRQPSDGAHVPPEPFEDAASTSPIPKCAPPGSSPRSSRRSVSTCTASRRARRSRSTSWRWRRSDPRRWRTSSGGWTCDRGTSTRRCSGRSSGRSPTGRAPSRAARERSTRSWIREGVHFTLHDSSGLSYANRATADGILHLLWAADAAPWGEVLRDSLPGGNQGTLEGRLPKIELRAKTGTLDHASALSGWVWLQRVPAVGGVLDPVERVQRVDREGDRGHDRPRDQSARGRSRDADLITGPARTAAPAGSRPRTGARRARRPGAQPAAS